MAGNTQKLLEEINTVSRQILSRILTMQTNSQVLPQDQDLKSTEISFINDENKELTKLIEKRKILITNLFEQNTAENISAESGLIQDMIALDNELTANAKLSKQAITEQMIKIKKSKKVTKSYQKY